MKHKVLNSSESDDYITNGIMTLNMHDNKSGESRTKVNEENRTNVESGRIEACAYLYNVIEFIFSEVTPSSSTVKVSLNSYHVL